jgi:excisionase family DNA binding protein
MKRTLLSVKELAHQLGISADSVYRAYRRKEIPPRKSIG